MKILEALAATIHAIPEALAGRASLLQHRLELDEAERAIAALGFHEPGRRLADDIRVLGLAWQEEVMRGVRLERGLDRWRCEECLAPWRAVDGMCKRCGNRTRELVPEGGSGS